MHELGIASSILDAVRAEADRRPGSRIIAVGLQVGEVSGVETDALTFCFEALTKGTEFENLSLEIERLPRRQRCPGCGREFEVVEFEVACPDCGEPRTEFLAGDELEIAFLEVDEP